MMVWLARRIVISLLIPFLWRWWRNRGASVSTQPSEYIPAGDPVAPATRSGVR